MAIKGSLREASLPDVLQLLALGRKTGCLAVADRHNFGYIYFDQGRICYASIVNRRDRLGDMLVKSSRITMEQLQEAVDRQHGDRHRRLGQILVDMDVLSEEELQRHIRIQIEEAVYYLFTWSSGTFNFEAGVRPDADELLVQINPESLLLEGARRVDEWSLIEKKIPSFDLIFAADHDRLDSAAVALAPEQERLLPLLDGARDVQQLIEDSGLVEFEAGKALYGLITAGFVHRVGTSTTAPPRVSEGRVEEHQNLGVAFYRTGMLDEAEREFRRVHELKPADHAAIFHLALIALRQARWEEGLQLLRQVSELGASNPAILHNLGVALEYLGRIEEAEAAYAEAVTRARGDARYMLSWAVAGLKREEFEVATGRLARAAELMGDRPPPPLWFWAAGLAAAGAGELQLAVEHARAGVEAWPANAVLRNNLSALLEFIGDVGAAETMARAAFEEEPTLPQASKNLGDLLYRAGRYDEALESYERAAKLDPELGDDLYFKLGNIAYRRHDQDRARECWRRATSLNPAHQLARSNLETLKVGA